MANKTQKTGYWTFMCNPKRWEIDKFLRSGVEVDTYRITPYQKDWFEKGQLGVIRVGRDNRTKKELVGRPKLESGIYALVEIISEAFSQEETNFEYYLNPPETTWVESLRISFRIIENLIDRPLLFKHLTNEAEIQQDPYLVSGFYSASIPLLASSYQRIVKLIEERDEVSDKEPKPKKAKSQRQFWQLKPGSNASQWERFQQEGTGRLSYRKLNTGDLRKYASKKALANHLEVSAYSNHVQALWQFRNAKRGEIVFAAKGLFEVLGVGVFEGEYNYDPSVSSPHNRPIRWLANQPLELEPHSINNYPEIFQRQSFGKTKIGKEILEAYLKKYPEYTEKLSFGLLEYRIARICWNTNGWISPSGPKGKSTASNTHEGRFGYGHEEWLLDLGKVLEDGYHYGFLEPVRKHQETYFGTSFHVRLYTYDKNSKKRYWIGEIRRMEVLSRQQAEEVEKIYKAKGWLNEMKSQLKEVTQHSVQFSKSSGVDRFNVRFKPEEVEIYESYREFTPDDSDVKGPRYIFLTDHSLPKEIFPDHPFQFHPQQPSPSLPTNKRTYERPPGHIERKYDHNKISQALYKRLVEKYGKDRVAAEHLTPFGTKIDMVVSLKNGKCILYEIKTFNSLKRCIREAIGQLLEYAFYPDQQIAEKLVIVSDRKEDKATMEYLLHLRKLTGLEIYYEYQSTTTEMQ